MDQYDEQIKALTENPELISLHWDNAEGLFKFVNIKAEDMPSDCGCLTMIRSQQRYSACFKGVPHPALTEEIRADERLPRYSCDIELSHLPVFAEWQRKIDAMQKQTND